MGEMINRFAQTNKSVRFRAEMSTGSTIKKELKSGEYVYALRDQFNELGERWTAVLYWNEFGYVMSEYLDVLSQSDSDIIQHADPSQSPVPAMSEEELDSRMYPKTEPEGTEVPSEEPTEQITASAATETEPGELIAVSIRTGEDLAVFSDCQYGVSNPLCIRCEDASLLERALRAYQGRALYEGDLPDDDLLPLARKYGLIF
jgi:hypothetical protein